MRPRLVVTPGDPTGIGPEITARVCSDPALLNRAAISVYGDQSSILQAFQLWGNAALLDVSQRPSPPSPGRCTLYDPHLNEPREVAPEVTALRAATAACLSGEAAALVTGPISKERLMGLGFPHPGHTRYLAELTGAPEPVMAFVSHTLRVGLVTDHVRFTEVPANLSVERIRRTTRICRDTLRDRYGIADPRLALCGLNPHAGEGGRLGTEEREVLTEAIEALRAEGINLSGPWPADSVFVHALEGRFDLVIALYHDQGLIPIKLLGRGASVHLTFGLPILRTSVDHGTAHDIAGRGVADPAGLKAAVDEALRLLS